MKANFYTVIIYLGWVPPRGLTLQTLSNCQLSLLLWEVGFSTTYFLANMITKGDFNVLLSVSLLYVLLLFLLFVVAFSESVFMLLFLCLCFRFCFCTNRPPYLQTCYKKPHFFRMLKKCPLQASRVIKRGREIGG